MYEHERLRHTWRTFWSYGASRATAWAASSSRGVSTSCFKYEYQTLVPYMSLVRNLGPCFHSCSDYSLSAQNAGSVGFPSGVDRQLNSARGHVGRRGSTSEFTNAHIRAFELASSAQIPEAIPHQSSIGLSSERWSSHLVGDRRSINSTLRSMAAEFDSGRPKRRLRSAVDCCRCDRDELLGGLDATRTVAVVPQLLAVGCGPCSEPLGATFRRGSVAGFRSDLSKAMHQDQYVRLIPDDPTGVRVAHPEFHDDGSESENALRQGAPALGRSFRRRALIIGA